MTRLSLISILVFIVAVWGLRDILAVAPANAESEPTVSEGYAEAASLLETWVESVLDFDRLPGISIAVVHDQELVYSGGFGCLDVERSVPMKPSTIFSVCSISKMFTAIALMQLRDAGKVSLDDPVVQYLPWIAPVLEGSEGPSPTLRDLLRHSSGLPCAPDYRFWSDPDSVYPSREELIRRIALARLSYPPSTTFNYSNLGYALIGEIVAVVSGMEYDDYVQEKILEPLGMESTTPFMPADELGDELAVGYGCWPRHGSRTTVPVRDARATTPAGGFASTVEDLARFAMWQFRVLDGAGESVLGQPTLQEMHAVQWSDPDWGLGFSIWNMGGKKFVGHQGGCPGYKSQFILCPEDKFAVVAMINATDAPQFTLVFRAHEIFTSSLHRGSSEAEEEAGYTRYVGFYTGDESWSAAEVLVWDSSLTVMWVPTPDPLGSLVKLARTDGEVFRQVQADGKPGKHYVFQPNAAGDIVGMRFNSNLLAKSVR